MKDRTRKILLFSALAVSLTIVLIDINRPLPPNEISEPSNIQAESSHTLDTPSPPTESILEIIPRTEETTSSHSFLPPAPPILPLPPPPQLPKSQPTPPPLPFTYLGRQNINGTWSVFISLQGSTKIIKTGDTIDDGWIVNEITPSRLNITYLPLKQSIVVTIGSE